MNFKDSHHNHALSAMKEVFKSVKHLVKDRRLRSSLVFLTSSIIVLAATYFVYAAKKEQLTTSIATLSSQTNELLHRLDVNRQITQIPKFEASMHAVGAYTPLLSHTKCGSQVTYCFLQKVKPRINITAKTLDVSPIHTLGSFTLDFQSSFDYEIFDMMEYIFSNPNKFGLCRLREFHIEQLFETSPIVKGRFIYDQLSLKP
jgi:hypothetical protein